MTIELSFGLLLGYFFGAIPFGLALTRMAGLGDIRKIGSGNIGATNVLRTGRKDIAAATLFLDSAKGTAAVVAAFYLWGETAALVAGVGAFLGHVFPVWLRFRGGKGVATYIGVLLALNVIVGVLFLATWAIMAFVRRISSLAALAAAAFAPLFALVWSGAPLAFTAGLLSALLFYNHRANIARLIKGTEPKIGASAKDGPPK
jgi:acyl phosphate:glycerol-3-phosphate acyltransferase